VQKYLVQKLGGSVAVTDEEVTKSLAEAATKELTEAKAQVVELQKGILSPGGRRIEALEDICWAILNTNEFLFQH
jgi:pyrroline-5-carboxylate reductase